MFMKNLILGAFALMVLSLTSCGGIKLDNYDNAAALNDVIAKNLKADANVTAINIQPVSSYLSTEVSSIHIYSTTADGKKHLTQIFLEPARETIDKELEDRTSSYSKSKADPGRPINDYDFMVAFTNISNAAQQVIDAGMTYSGVGSYNIKFSSDPAKDKHSFSILSKAGTSTRGRNIVTEYYEIDAEADAEGNVTVEIPTEE